MLPRMSDAPGCEQVGAPARHARAANQLQAPQGGQLAERLYRSIVHLQAPHQGERGQTAAAVVLRVGARHARDEAQPLGGEALAPRQVQVAQLTAVPGDGAQRCVCQGTARLEVQQLQLGAMPHERGHARVGDAAAPLQVDLEQLRQERHAEESQIRNAALAQIQPLQRTGHRARSWLLGGAEGSGEGGGGEGVVADVVDEGQVQREQLLVLEDLVQLLGLDLFALWSGLL